MSLQTEYNGRIYRSRVEAKWAAVFTHAAPSWEFEPKCFKLAGSIPYWPDFRLHTGAYVEVKGVPVTPTHFIKAQELAKLGEDIFVVAGEPLVFGSKGNYWLKIQKWPFKRIPEDVPGGLFRVLPEGISRLEFNDTPTQAIEDAFDFQLPQGTLGDILEDIKTIQLETPPFGVTSMKHVGRDLSDSLAGWTQRTHESA